jgi:O-antigen/teichoic acid export membrane protein
VGFYAAAERIVNALHVLTVNPFTSVMLPRISTLIREDVGQAAAVLKRVGAFFVFISFLETGMILAFAPLVIQILYGPDYRASVPVLQWLAWLLPGAVLFNALAVQWMLALKLDQVFTRITVATGIVNVLVGLLLATRAGAIGMSGAVVLAQWIAVILSVWVLRARGLFPWRMRGSDAAQ